MWNLLKMSLKAIIHIPPRLEDLSLRVQDAISLHQGSTIPEERLARLEASQASIIAEAEALVLRAESQLKAARAAEERARGMERRAREAQLADGDEEGPDPFLEAAHDFQTRNGAGGPGSGVPSMPAHVARPSGKELARLAKHGGY